jgi:hypothetical protein
VISSSPLGGVAVGVAVGLGESVGVAVMLPPGGGGGSWLLAVPTTMRSVDTAPMVNDRMNLFTAPPFNLRYDAVGSASFPDFQ